MAKRMINAIRIASAYGENRRRDERGRYTEDDERRYTRDNGQSGEVRRRNEGRGEDYTNQENWQRPIYREREPRIRRENIPDTRENITDMREYGRRYSPQNHMDTGQHQSRMPQQRQIGFQHDEEHGMHLSREKAQEWVDNMRNPKWPRMEDVRVLAQKVGAAGEQEAEFWAALNATYSDVSKVAKKYNVDRSDFYADLAKALFFDDEDAVEGKPMMYYEYIVRKDEG